ncbi:MAG: DUF971 domain-containing protein [Gammaproteobacteria bacterium]|nr:DUF971 domain-containing protein [Gammaproteobacteria bacterium]
MTPNSSPSKTPHTTTTPSHLEIQDAGNILKITWNDGSSDRYHAIWLRDNGQDPQTRDPANRQKLVTLQHIPCDTEIRTAKLNSENQVEFVFSPDEKETAIDAGWLKSHCYDHSDQPDLLPDHIVTWDKQLARNLPKIDFEQAVSNVHDLMKWLEYIDRYGFAIMSKLPLKKDIILKVIALFGYVRETNYGQIFEVRTETNPINLAYTGKGLQVHTDNPYRDPVPTLQILTCLQNDAEGGESIVVDGFRALEILQREAPYYFELLSRYNARFDYQQGDDIHLHTSKPMIDCTLQGQVTGIRFNNRSCDTLTDIPFDKMEDYYRAYRRLGEILETSQLEVTFNLEPNELFVVDNTRVLHGRTEFSGTGARWLQGAYADKDSLKSKLSTLRKMMAK